MLSKRNLLKRSSCLLAAFGASLFLAGCPDPDASFAEFAARYAKAHPPGPPAECGTTVQKVDGDFLFTLSASLLAKKPLLFDAKLVTDDAGVKITVQALAIDRKTIVGDPVELGPYPIDASGKLVADLPQLTIPGEANPITKCAMPPMCDLSVIVADSAISGAVCEDFICGDVTGQVTKPITLDLKDSTFTMERLEMPGVYPEPPQLNCKGDLALPVDKI